MTLFSEPAHGRHRASRTTDPELRIATLTDVARRGRHAEPEEQREQAHEDRRGFGSGAA